MNKKIKPKSLGGMTPAVSVNLLSVVLPWIVTLWRSLFQVPFRDWNRLQAISLFGSIVVLGAIGYALLTP